MQASVDAANALLLAVLINVSLLKASPQGDGDLAEGLCSRHQVDCVERLEGLSRALTWMLSRVIVVTVVEL
jgi:hypothetical protein